MRRINFVLRSVCPRGLMHTTHHSATTSRWISTRSCAAISYTLITRSVPFPSPVASQRRCTGQTACVSRSCPERSEVYPTSRFVADVEVCAMNRHVVPTPSLHICGAMRNCPWCLTSQLFIMLFTKSGVCMFNVTTRFTITSET